MDIQLQFLEIEMERTETDGHPTKSNDLFQMVRAEISISFALREENRFAVHFFKDKNK